MKSRLAIGLALVMAVAGAARAAEEKPLKVLLIAGGCAHDYLHQKDILKTGLEARVACTVDIIFSEDRSTHPPLPIYGHPDYAKGYDVVVHDECSAGVSDPGIIADVLKPHRDGLPAVNLHCAMHCYRIGNPGEAAKVGTVRAQWFEYLGVQSSGHGAQLPIAIRFTDKDSPIVKGMADWTTIKEELYNNIVVFDNAHELARGQQIVPQKNGTAKTNEYVVAWTSSYGQTRVFSTTLGHNNVTVSDPRYLDLVARGLLWAVGRPVVLKQPN